MLYDFHTHSLLSDGELLPIELIRRAYVMGYEHMAISDHASAGSLERVVKETLADCELARSYWKIMAIPAVELTHIPPASIDKSARKAKELGAWLVLVHGETIVEPVEAGTNQAAIESEYVDILAHPGLITLKQAKLASARGLFMEISGRKGHCLTNGLVALLSQKTGVRLLLNSDAHSSHELLGDKLAKQIARGSGLKKRDLKSIFSLNPESLLEKILKNRGPQP